MWTRHLGFCAPALLFALLGGGCKESTAGQPQPIASLHEPVITVHWLGIKHLTSDPMAAAFLKIWRLPQSEKLKNQTLDKLAIAPWRLSGTNRPPADTNYAALVRGNKSASLIRPLLDDLIQDESYLEIRETKDNQGQLGLAVRLDAQRATAWNNALAAVLETTTSAQRVPATSGWKLSARNPDAVSPLLRHVELTRAGDWTVVGFGTEQNSVFSNLVTSLQTGKTKLSSFNPNSWVETIMDLPRASRIFAWGWKLPVDWPRISLSFSGSGSNMITTGSFEFSRPLPFQVERWNIPTSLVHEPLHSFMAVQGMQHWLSSWSDWQNLHAGPAPNQLFGWSQPASAFLDYVAAPLATAPSAMPKIGTAIMDSLNPVLATNRMGKWERASNSDAVQWRGPVIAPFVQSIATKESEWLFGGLWPYGLTNGAAPAGTFKELLGQPNLVYYQREITGPRVEAWLYISQVLRLISRRPQLPPFAAIPWLKAVEPLLGNSTTMITKSGPNRLELSRKSDLGLTAFEMHLLSDWLESAEFPIRLNSRRMSPLNQGHRSEGAVSPRIGK